mmetsp:Transcript_1584/g.2867  ORF Transcript_1584/g.2867 Transcript_1584/m.2867 type:complete len:219 (-) Transcript_1584:165-821(-)
MQRAGEEFSSERRCKGAVFSSMAPASWTTPQLLEAGRTSTTMLDRSSFTEPAPPPTSPPPRPKAPPWTCSAPSMVPRTPSPTATCTCAHPATSIQAAGLPSPIVPHVLLAPSAQLSERQHALRALLGGRVPFPGLRTKLPARCARRASTLRRRAPSPAVTVRKANIFQRWAQRLRRTVFCARGVSTARRQAYQNVLSAQALALLTAWVSFRASSVQRI